MPFSVNKCIREIQGQMIVEARAWRGNLVVAKYRDTDYSAIIDASTADYPIIKNYLSTHPAYEGIYRTKMTKSRPRSRFISACLDVPVVVLIHQSLPHFNSIHSRLPCLIQLSMRVVGFCCDLPALVRCCPAFPHHYSRLSLGKSQPRLLDPQQARGVLLRSFSPCNPSLHKLYRCLPDHVLRTCATKPQRLPHCLPHHLGRLPAFVATCSLMSATSTNPAPSPHTTARALPCWFISYDRLSPIAPWRNIYCTRFFFRLIDRHFVSHRF